MKSVKCICQPHLIYVLAVKEQQAEGRVQGIDAVSGTIPFKLYPTFSTWQSQ